MKIGTLTDQGTFLGMEGNLARFEKFIIEGQTMIIKCSPKIAKIITQQEENQRIANEHECRDLGIWYNAILRGSEARSAISAFKESIAV